MARNNDAVLLAQSARFYIGDVGTKAPSSLREPGVGWEELGHTSPDEVFSWGSEGGESTFLGSLQSGTLRSNRTARTESVTITLLQWDAKTLPFYFGADLKLIDGSDIFMGVKSKPAPIKKALLIVIDDGENSLGIYAPSTEIARGDDLSIDTGDELSGLPVNFTFLNHNSNDWAFSITPVTPNAGVSVSDGDSEEG